MLFTCLLKASPKPESDGSRIPHTVRGSLPHFSSAVRVGHLRSREAGSSVVWREGARRTGSCSSRVGGPRLCAGCPGTAPGADHPSRGLDVGLRRQDGNLSFSFLEKKERE